MRSYLILLLALCASACDALVDPACDICTTSATVRGTVTANGVPVAGAKISASIGDAECSHVYSSGDPDALTAADGSYAFTIVTMLAPAERCAQLLIEPAASSGLVAQHGSEFTVRFRADHVRHAVRDTVEHHVALITPP